MDQLRETLKGHHLRTTTCREDVLSTFISKKNALSHGDLEGALGENYDRVTIYRTLKTFLEKGIIHTIPTSDNAIQYALCKDDCRQGHHHDNHVHFICDSCHTTICLEGVTVPTVTLPKGFTPSDMQMVVRGKCAECK